MKKQAGFTLIELMIVVAIIGILAAIALPAYQDYTIRAKVSECSGIIAACKTSVSEYYASENAMPADNTEAGCATTETQYCSAPAVANGVITVTASASATGLPSDCNLILTPQLTGTVLSGWEGSTNCDPKYVAATFR